MDVTIDPRYIRGTEAAVAHWNSLVGSRFLYMTPHTGDVWEPCYCIDVRERDLGSNQRHDHIWGLNTPTVGVNGRIIRSLVEFDEDLADHLIFAVALHEMGHALGLRHDEEHPNSVMYPFIDGSGNQRVQPEDVEAVRLMLP